MQSTQSFQPTDTSLRKIEPYPWHTRAFHVARFCMISAFLVFAITHVHEFGMQFMGFAYSVVVLLIDGKAIQKWQRGEAVLPGPKALNSKEGMAQYGMLRWALVGVVGSFLGLLLFTFAMMGHMKGTLDYIGWGALLIGANLAGMNVIRWCGEAMALVKRYKGGNITPLVEQSRGMSHVSTTVQHGTAQPEQKVPLVLRAGAGRAP